MSAHMLQTCRSWARAPRGATASACWWSLASAALFAAIASGAALAATPAAGAALSTEDYARAESRLPGRIAIPNLRIDPQWIDGKRFWYRRDTGDGGRAFVIVDAATGTRRPAFDHTSLARALAPLTDVALPADALPLRTLRFDDDGIDVGLDGADALQARCNLRADRCTRLPAATTATAAAPGQVLSPDGRWAAFVQDHNLYLREIVTGATRALTRDGALHNAWATVSESQLNTLSHARGLEVWGDAHDSARVLWSPDSKTLATYRIDERHVPEMPYIDYIGQGYGSRPVMKTARVGFPIDREVASATLSIFAIDGRRTDLRTDPLLVHYDLLQQGRLWWSADATQLYFLHDERGFRTLSLRVADASSGATRQILEERSRTSLWPPYAEPSRITAGDAAEVFWLSERSGWNHLYRHDRHSGALLSAMTEGDWRVDDIVHVDPAGRWVYLTARGREPGRDPYYQHLYRVRFDGSGLQLLTPEDAQHEIAFSPDGRHFIDRHSRVDSAPVTTLRQADGREVAVLERADLGALIAAGWQKPERFKVKGRDGRTDIYGVLYRPSNFDPARRYPVIDAIYGGPQTIYAPTAFTPGMAIAELGFIVVQMDGMGTPGRSRAFHEASYGAGFAEAGGLPDHVAGIRELAARHTFIDADRVGIVGHSAGGYAAVRALLDHSDVYKVAVSSAGSHDQRLYQLEWGERFVGHPFLDPDSYRTQANVLQAGKLRGKLLLMQGELDDDVHPVNTMQLVDALMQANKDFDLLLFPRGNHGLGSNPYFIRRQWDYFVRHLLGAEPPPDYRIGK